MAIGNVAFHPAFGTTYEPVLTGPKGASEAWATGAQLIVTANLLLEAGSDHAALTIAGIAAQATTTAAASGTMIQYYPNFEGALFVGTMNVAAGGFVLLLDDFLKDFGTLVDADGIHYINHADTTAPSVRIMGFVDPVGTANAKVIFTYLTGPHKI